ncbi:MAG TPA: hypothetical protein VLE20_12870, partial [Blastocatellia bacterium]|nr:hypothetical protein [Blastocatellia bacterium]
ITTARDSSTVARYCRGAPLADSADLLAQVGHLLGIHKALRTLFPYDLDLAYRRGEAPPTADSKARRRSR